MWEDERPSSRALDSLSCRWRNLTGGASRGRLLTASNPAADRGLVRGQPGRKAKPHYVDYKGRLADPQTALAVCRPSFLPPIL